MVERPRTDDLGAEAGQTSPLALVVVALALGAAALVATLGGLVHDRAAARSAADAAALAGALGGRPAAEAVAEANGAELVELRDRGAEVEARVRFGRAEATSRARGVP